MKSKLLTISQAAKMIGISVQTMRRWDDSGRLISVRQKKTGHRYYKENDIEKFTLNGISDALKFAKKWVAKKSVSYLPALFYCQDVSIFQARLSKLETDLSKIKRIANIFPLITAITGEIGNNSFDHNLGNWPDVPGVLFAYDLEKGQIILADRGQGILKTLKNVKPNLETHQEALKVAFTEIISGRSPEYRGNGLKFVREVVVNNKIDLLFQSGDAELKIKKADSNLEINKLNMYIQGCFALIKF